MQALPTFAMAISSLPSSSARRFIPRCDGIAADSTSSSFGRYPCFIFLPFSASRARALELRAVKGAQVGRIGSSQGPASQEPLRRPLVSPSSEDEEDEVVRRPRGDDAGEVEDPRGASRRRRQDWLDWEDQILQDTVPLVSFVRMILHSGKYESGDRLSPEHEKMILERLLPYHPEFESKIGCGVDFITVGYHPEFESSRCLFIVRKNGEVVDFSYWKCVKGLIRKRYPLYADSFILRHFRKRRQ